MHELPGYTFAGMVRQRETFRLLLSLSKNVVSLHNNASLLNNVSLYNNVSLNNHVSSDNNGS